MREDTFKKAERFFTSLEHFTILKDALTDGKQFQIHAYSGKGHVSCIIPDTFDSEFKSLLEEWINKKIWQIKYEIDRL